MLSEERQRAILEILSRDGRVLVVDLAKQFHTSVVTIRKDLEILHMKGRIHRTHGGALTVAKALSKIPPYAKKRSCIARKNCRLLRRLCAWWRKDKLSYWIREQLQPPSPEPCAISRT